MHKWMAIIRYKDCGYHFDYLPVKTKDSMTKEMRAAWIEHWQFAYPTREFDSAEWFSMDHPIWLEVEALDA